MVAIMFGIAAAGANGKFPALFAFGDSILDTGNNNNLRTLTKSNFPPNGRNFIGGQPTGRFSDGKVLSDVIAAALGIKDTLPPYLDPKLRNEELSTGVCFASAGSGKDDLTSDMQGVLRQWAQLQNFKEYITRLKAVVGEERANNITSNALYLISAGNNDIAITYSSTIKRNIPFPLYASQLVASASHFIKQLYEIGARKVWVLSTLPLGCLPGGRTAGGGPLRLCADIANGQAQLFNARLASAVTSLQRTLPASSLQFLDVYTPLLNTIQNPSTAGFSNVANGCCGRGQTEMATTCTLLVGSCPNPKSYVFWDAGHPTRRAYEVIAEAILSNTTYLR
ncbi:hypothetical protein PIB30_051622 [Stylosanthes scabra]|uniref:GDSL esterase/lipase n=1 Tax=Stylosanthes scabra TaxID=79078 RepID=A0ABU6THP3_9FABA|nr:hypothetical protein [Stylosanthes scabra]